MTEACEDFNEDCRCKGCRTTRNRIEGRRLADELRSEEKGA